MDRISFIKLDQFLKHVQAVSTGGQAKMVIQSGQVTVNGEVEVRRGRKLVAGDQVTVMGMAYRVDCVPAPNPPQPSR